MSGETVSRISAQARQSAVSCGKDEHDKILDNLDWGWVDDCKNAIWDDFKLNRIQKFELGFELFEIFPGYWPSTEFYRSVREKPDYDWSFLWIKLISYLKGPPYWRDPISYLLWVDFFEDQDTVQTAWTGLVSNTVDTDVLSLLVEYSGPVPMSLKMPLINILLRNPKTHESILKGLALSISDIYGQTDKTALKKVFPKLKASPKTEYYRYLLKELF